MKLYVFPVSHFSEKARWACDHHQLDYELVSCVPGPHVATLKRLGVKRTTVPVLTRPDGPAIQGSSRIIAHLDAQQPARSLTPADDTWKGLEVRADRDLGETVRRIMYAEMMTRSVVVPVWSHGGPWWSGPLLHAAFPFLKSQITKGYKLNAADVAAAKGAFETTWNEFETRLGSKPYFMEERLTRLDITVASLLAPLVAPPAHPFPYGGYPRPAVLDPFVAHYRDRPLWRYVERLYREERTKRKPRAAVS